MASNMWPQTSGVLCPVQIPSCVGTCCLTSTGVKVEIKTDRSEYLREEKLETLETVNVRVTFLHSLYMLFEYHRC